MHRSAAAAAAVLALALAGCTSSSSAPTDTVSQNPSGSPRSSAAPTSTAASTFPPAPDPYRSPPATLPTGAIPLSTGPAPWPAPALANGGANSADYVAAAGVPYGEETTQVHYHAHLDVNVDGSKVPVPAYLGFVTKNGKALGLAPLHTHDPTGIIHVENSVPAKFVLGQVFIEWGVTFTDKCLGSYCSGNGKELAVFVNGKRYSGDPTRIVFTPHQEIAVEYGDAGHLPTPPSSYDFPPGD
jgi:hypothetical protein